MSRNEGTVDRFLRIVFGLALLSLVFIGPKTMWGLVGLVPLLTGLAGYCPLVPGTGVQHLPDEEITVPRIMRLRPPANRRTQSRDYSCRIFPRNRARPPGDTKNDSAKPVAKPPRSATQSALPPKINPNTS